MSYIGPVHLMLSMCLHHLAVGDMLDKQVLPTYILGPTVHAIDL